MFKAYFDRSELGKLAPVMAVSGYLGAEDEWQQFEPAWHQVLGTIGVDMFHMTEFECRLRVFHRRTPLRTSPIHSPSIVTCTFREPRRRTSNDAPQ